MLGRIALVVLVGFLGLAYEATKPPPPKLCGSPNGPPITSPRIKLRDGRHLAYKETGVPKEKATYKIILAHGLRGTKDMLLPVSPELVEELGMYFLTFDRAGYGESDPNPKRSVKSDAFDIEELGDQLELGSKFYVIGISMGGCSVWGCLKYIPHRLAGATLLVPVVNYFWPSFPANLSSQAYKLQFVQDQWGLRVAHYAPRLVYWWMTQKWFPSSAILSRNPEVYSRQDKEIIKKVAITSGSLMGKALQQGEFESMHRDLMVGFGTWEFDPMELDNPFPNNEASVHLWQGYEDRFVPFSLQRYVSKRLPWIKYHEVPDGGHLFMFANGWSDIILRALLLGEEPSTASSCYTVIEGVTSWETNQTSTTANLSSQANKLQFVQDQWALRLVYWWMTQKWFPSSAIASRNPEVYSRQDKEIIKKVAMTRGSIMGKALQQGEFESMHRDLMVGFGTWEFDPMELDNPFPNNEASVHLWQGYEDRIVPFSLQRYVSKRLPWIKYHEIPDGGHLFMFANGMIAQIALALMACSLGWAYKAIKPPSPKICGSSNGPPITSPRIKLRDGRHLAYKESGVSKDKAKYKIVVVHPFGGSRNFKIPASQGLVEDQGIYFLTFDKPGYGESDPNPKRSVKSDAFDIQELADQMELGSKFYVIGVSMGGCSVWGCLKYIPHRLAGASLIVPVVNYWWPSFPKDLCRVAFRRTIRDPWRLRIVHYAPFLVNWYMNQKWLRSLGILDGNSEVFSLRDKEIYGMMLANGPPVEDKARQQGDHESIYRDSMVGFGTWEFDPMDLNSPFPNNEGSVHLWHGYEDGLVPFDLQRYVSKRLPWIKYHEIPDGGHLFMFADGWSDTILRALLLGEEPSTMSS
ncbi:uncharacterized protein LOC143876365 [Tasmannia lanceolata]|uniref:uncharacterized protein LOC143876365 n=1 Tax=Tasmannia lanceolata TaxID=3420 RepID=UPI0040641E85